MFARWNLRYFAETDKRHFRRVVYSIIPEMAFVGFCKWTLHLWNKDAVKLNQHKG